MKKRTFLLALSGVLLGAVLVCTRLLLREPPPWTVQEFSQFDVIRLTQAYTREPDASYVNTGGLSVQFAHGVQEGYQFYAGDAASPVPITPDGRRLSQSHREKLPDRWLAVAMTRSGMESKRAPYRFDLYQVEDTALLSDFQEALVNFHGRHFLCVQGDEVMRIDEPLVYFIFNTFRDDIWRRIGIEFQWALHYQPVDIP